MSDETAMKALASALRALMAHAGSTKKTPGQIGKHCMAWAATTNHHREIAATRSTTCSMTHSTIVQG